LSTYSASDRCTDTILDFVAGGVAGNPNGESGGNYNAVSGDPRATDDLSLKTLAEIYTLMDGLEARGAPSTATGRYQFIRATLQHCQVVEQLPDTALFTEALQDKFAVLLLVGRGYRDWYTEATNPDGSRKVTDQDFEHNLSCEWASLPDPQNGGRSHYDRDAAGNHAQTTLDAVDAMLDRAQQAKGAA
jgi:muramidase (phage lysozyme)